MALEQAGSLLTDAHLDADSYLRLLAERADELFDQGHDGLYPRSVTASWTVGFDRLVAADPAAMDLLTLLAWCAPAPVPLSLFTEHPTLLPERLRRAVADPLAFSRGTRLLRRRGMATIAPHSVALHRVPAAVLRARSHTAPEAWPAVLLRLLRAALPGDIWDNPVVWPQWQSLLAHVLTAVEPDRGVEDAADELGWLLDRAATYQHTRGNPRAALRLFQRGYALRRDRLGEDHPDTLASANNLAVDLYGLGDYQQARTLDEDTLTRQRRVLFASSDADYMAVL